MSNIETVKNISEAITVQEVFEKHFPVNIKGASVIDTFNFTKRFTIQAFDDMDDFETVVKFVQRIKKEVKAD